jgi:hypothetical protein
MEEDLFHMTHPPFRRMRDSLGAGAERTAPHRENDSVGTGQATWLVPRGTSQLRDSAGFAPDFADHRATRAFPPERRHDSTAPQVHANRTTASENQRSNAG